MSDGVMEKLICSCCGRRIDDDYSKSHDYAMFENDRLKLIEALNTRSNTEKFTNIIDAQAQRITKIFTENKRLQKRVAELEEARRWIPVDEKLPENVPYQRVSENVICKNDKLDYSFIAYYMSSAWFSANKGTWWSPDSEIDYKVKVTHWMPYPKVKP